MNWSSEIELLLCCARTQINDETAAQIQNLARDPLDWSSVLQLADEHMVLPLLHQALDEVVPDAVPPAVQDRLRTAFHANVRNNLLLTHELMDLLALFDEHDIPAVPFKGPVAAASVYDDLHLRPFGDLDLLVSLEDVTRAQTLLLDRQFEDWEPLPPLDVLDFDRPPSWYSALTEPFGKAKTYVRATEQGDKVPIELHWELMPPYFRHPLDPEPLWERLRTVPLQGTPVPTFSPEDTLLHFCLHGTVHRWSHLRLVCDVAEFLRRPPEVEWNQLIGRADKLDSERLLLLGLRLAHELLGAPLPASIRHRTYGNNRVDSLAQRRQRQLFRDRGGVASIWNSYVYDAQIRDRFVDGIGLCIADTWAALPKYLRGL
ncbi:MAG: nucleotidyltransferase family protein [Salinibacter sp.]|uniref:nucleotidyltransferase family protein n=1 Tax=Salinibacter sp. TaxID=2065818 RepID=UPI0035D4767D